MAIHRNFERLIKTILRRLSWKMVVGKSVHIHVKIFEDVFQRAQRNANSKGPTSAL